MKTRTQIQTDYRRRKRDQGYSKVETWISPEQEDCINRLVSIGTFKSKAQAVSFAVESFCNMEFERD